MYEYYSERKEKRFRWKHAKKTILAIFVLAGILGLFLTFLPPSDFPSGQVVSIEEGSSLESIANDFESKGLIKSAGIFKTFVIGVGGDKHIAAGDYLFKNPLSSFDLALRVARGEFGIKKIAVTLPEGLTVDEMGELLAEKLPEFNLEEFSYLTKDLEGYLFPDTYFFFPTAKPADVVRMMRDTFERKVGPKIRADVESSGRDFEDIIIMASIIQDEAYDGYEEKRMISGILWKRLEKGMRLQTDATLKYVTGRGSAQLTNKDLTSDNPYNTYTRYGLPPTPIGNSGLDAIRAAIDPKDSDYLFYLHDANGHVHYGKTFEEHKQNIGTYLR